MENVTNKQALVDAVEKLSAEELKALVIRQAEAEGRKREQRKAYMLKNKDKRAAYTKKRNALRNALLRRAKELGLDKEL